MSLTPLPLLNDLTLTFEFPYEQHFMVVITWGLVLNHRGVFARDLRRLEAREIAPMRAPDATIGIAHRQQIRQILLREARVRPSVQASG